MDKATLNELAQGAVDRFVRRFDKSYRQLVDCAALPLILTPQLLNYIRNQLLWGKVPWVAEVDLLLSDLCREVGYEQYAMDVSVRAYLLEKMKETPEGQERMQKVARLLLSYIRYLAQTNPYIGQDELEAQQWGAMVYLDDQREKAVREIAEYYRKSFQDKNFAEMEYLSEIVQELEQELSNYPGLIEYAKLVSKILYQSDLVSSEDYPPSYKVLDVELLVPIEKKPTESEIKEAEKFAERAIELQLQQDYQTAIKNIDKAIELDPYNGDYVFKKGFIFVEQGKIEEAIEITNRAIDLTPDSAILYKARAMWHIANDNYRAAINDLTYAIGLNPEQAYNYLNLAIESYYHIKDYEIVLAIANYAIGLEPKEVDSYLKRGRIHLYSGNFTAALKDFDYVVQLKPKYVLGYELRSQAYYKLESYDDAINDGLHIIKLRPNNGVNYYFQSLYYLAAKDYDNALTYMNRSYELDKDDTLTLAYTPLWRGVIYKLTGKLEESKVEWEQALQEAQKISDDDKRLIILALLAILTQQAEQAKEYFQQLLDKHLLLMRWFKTRFYFKLIMIMFPSRNDIQELYNWLEEKFK